MTNEVDPAEAYVLKNHVLVHFRFHEVDGLEVAGGNRQNVLADLCFRDIRDHRMEGIEWEVELAPCFGLGATFQCRGVEIADVTPCGEDAQPLSS